MASAHLTRFDTIQPANIEWRNQAPFNSDYDDVYFSTNNGLEESTHVFAKGCQLETDWTNREQTDFYITELGFGSGLNFLVTADLWKTQISQSNQNKHKHLHYLSIEKRPFKLTDIIRALRCWPMFSEIAEELISNYPSTSYGRHQIQFKKLNLTLTLFYMPVEEALTDLIKESDLQQQKLIIDHWFLDGFAPDKNKAMWTESVCNNIAQLSREGSRLATFSVAAAVKNPLKQAGFIVTKRRGVGLKREVLSAVFQKSLKTSILNNEQLTHQVSQQQKQASYINLKYESPWFNLKKTTGDNRVAIIGAGLAGCATAYSLHQKGLKIELFEAENSIAEKASGAAAGIFHPQLTADMNLNSQFNWLSYLYLLRFIANLSPLEKDRIVICQGVKRLLKSSKEKQQLLELSNSLLFSDWIWDDKNKETSSPDNNLLQTSDRSIFFPHSAAIDIPEFCQLLLNKIPENQLKLTTNCQIDSIKNEKDSWVISCNKTSYQFKNIIFCGGAHSKLLPQFVRSPGNTSRGQTCYLQLPELHQQLKNVLSEKSYIVPARKKSCFQLGTTFEDFIDDQLNEQSQNTILQNSNHLLREQKLPHLSLVEIESQPLNGSMGYRLHSTDRLPVIGGVENLNKLKLDFNQLGNKRITRESISYYNQPGLWVNTAYGSHGLLYSLLGSQHLASLISNSVSPVNTQLSNALSPVRFQVKNLKNNQFNQYSTINNRKN